MLQADVAVSSQVSVIDSRIDWRDDIKYHRNG
jgi:hypothetical protein